MQLLTEVQSDHEDMQLLTEVQSDHEDMQLLTEVQSDHEERITVAEHFTFIQRKMFLSKSGREGSPKQ